MDGIRGSTIAVTGGARGPIMDEAAKLLADPKAYTDEVAMHRTLAHLRAEAPVSWVDVPGYAPFWVITKHADIMAIERANDVFQLAATGPDDDRGRRAAGGDGHQHADPHG
jgi:cytochrome P450